MTQELQWLIMVSHLQITSITPPRTAPDEAILHDCDVLPKMQVSLRLPVQFV